MVMSGESTPILSSSIPAFETFMSSWEQLAEKHPRLSQWIDIGMAKATEYYARMDHTSAYIMSMCEYLNLWIAIITLTVISSESFHSFELDPAELVGRVHRRR
jgi:hypothetical protein